MKVLRAVLLGLAIVVLAACGGSVGSTAEKAGGSPSSNVAQQGSSGSTSGASRQNIQIVASGFTQEPKDSIGNSYVVYGVVLKNPNAAWAAEYVNVNLTFTDAAGGVVASESEHLSVVLPSQTMAVGDMAQAAGVAKLTVQAMVTRWEQINSSTGGFTVSGVTTASDQWSTTTKGTVQSTFAKDLQNLYSVAIYYDASGTVVGGAFTFIDFVPASGTIGFEIHSMNVVPNVAKTEVYIGLSSLTLLGS